MFNLDAVQRFRDDFMKLDLPGHDGQNPLNLVAALFHELVEHAYGNDYRMSNGILAGDTSANPHFVEGRKEEQGNRRTMRDVVQDYGHEHAVTAEARLREEMAWPEIEAGGWRDVHPEGRDQPNRLQVTFRARRTPGTPPPQEWTVLVHHDAQGGLIDAVSYRHPSALGLYMEHEPWFWTSEGALRAYRGLYVGR